MSFWTDHYFGARIMKPMQVAGIDSQALVIGADDRGAADFLAGRHLNPYDYETQGEKFRMWIVGYRSARLAKEAAEQQDCK